MKATTALSCMILLAILCAGALADDAPDDGYRVFLPVVMGSPASPNLIPNPDFELGQLYWPALYNTVYYDLPDPYPPRLSGRAYAMMGGWHRDEWMSSWDIQVKPHTEALYRLRVCWHTYPDDATGDVLHLTLRESGTNDPLLFLADYGDERPSNQWMCSYWTFSFGEAQTVHLWFASDQDEVTPYRTWYIDYTSLTEMDPDPVQECEECVVCQLQDQTPVTFCDHGSSCEELNPRCPMLPPPLFYREVGRECTCGDRVPLNEEVCR